MIFWKAYRSINCSVFLAGPCTFAIFVSDIDYFVLVGFFHRPFDTAILCDDITAEDHQHGLRDGSRGIYRLFQTTPIFYL